MLPSPETVRAVSAALQRAYGRPPRQEPGDPLDGLIGTMLSQNTTSANSRAAFRELKRRFPTWRQCLAAPTSAVVEAIRSAGLAHIRGPRIQQVLAQVEREHGRLSLDSLHDIAPRRAFEYLQTLPGVGPKTAACVLLFSCRKQVFPVDTHVARVTRRLGWVPKSASPDAIQGMLEPVVPAGLRYALHVNLIAHGRARCHPSEPECSGCPLLEHCPTRRGRGHGGY
jgi:endonuclease-3